jgi:IS1 family transposase
MNKLSKEKQTQIIQCLVEGNSIRATCRMTGAAKGTVLRLLADVGIACAKYQDEKFLMLDSKLIQCDEIWSFCYSKEASVPEDKQGQFGYGDVYTWVAIDADTKLVMSFFVGKRDLTSAHIFIEDLAIRLKNRVQLTTDGNRAYLRAVDRNFGNNNIDYGMLVKLYGCEADGERRYSPAKCLGTIKEVKRGNPDLAKTSTSYVERQNLTMRMSMRRFTRLTNGFSKKIENHFFAVSLHFMYYNFCRIHNTLTNPLPQTPAMASGITDHVWTIKEMLDTLLCSN